MFRAVVVVAMLALLVGCVRPQGTKALPNIQLSPSPVVVARAPLTIANPVFHSDEVGVAYAPVTLSATGGLPPYTWNAVGALPAGLTLSSDGIVSGTPTQGGNFVFLVQVLDFGNNDTAGVPASIGIVPRLTASLVSGCATECTVELGCVTVCGNFGQVSGGSGPLTYTLTSGPLPAGTTLNGLSLNGTFTGLPGRLQFTVQVTDGFGAIATISPRYNLLPHISLASGTCYGDFGIGCSTQLPVAGGSGAASVSLVSVAQNPNPNPPGNYQGTCWYVAITSPPSGYGLSASPSYVTVSIPKGDISGYGAIWTLTVTDRNLCGSGTYCSSPPATVRIGVQCG